MLRMSQLPDERLFNRTLFCLVKFFVVCEVGGLLCSVGVLYKLCVITLLCVVLLLFVWEAVEGGGNFDFYFYVSIEEIKRKRRRKKSQYYFVSCEALLRKIPSR